MNDDSWLEHLQMLLARFSHLGMGDDMAGMTITEVWGLYQFLSRLAGD